MRTEPKTFDLTADGWPNMWGYKPINDTQAKITGNCSPFDKIKTGDTLLLKFTQGKGSVTVDQIHFTNEVYEATITLGHYL